MPLREHADSGVPLVVEDPEDAAAQAIRQVARGLIAMAPMDLPVLPLVQVGAPEAPPPVAVPAAAPAPVPSSEDERKPAGMSLPMA
jgi:ATP-binding protein involved in chromosome partitioning